MRAREVIRALGSIDDRNIHRSSSGFKRSVGISCIIVVAYDLALHHEAESDSFIAPQHCVSLLRAQLGAAQLSLDYSPPKVAICLLDL